MIRKRAGEETWAKVQWLPLVLQLQNRPLQLVMSSLMPTPLNTYPLPCWFSHSTESNVIFQGSLPRVGVAVSRPCTLVLKAVTNELLARQQEDWVIPSPMVCQPMQLQSFQMMQVMFWPLQLLNQSQWSLKAQPYTTASDLLGLACVKVNTFQAMLHSAFRLFEMQTAFSFSIITLEAASEMDSSIVDLILVRLDSLKLPYAIQFALHPPTTSKETTRNTASRPTAIDNFINPHNCFSLPQLTLNPQFYPRTHPPHLAHLPLTCFVMQLVGNSEFGAVWLHFIFIAAHNKLYPISKQKRKKSKKSHKATAKQRVVDALSYSCCFFCQQILASSRNPQHSIQYEISEQIICKGFGESYQDIDPKDNNSTASAHRPSIMHISTENGIGYCLLQSPRTSYIYTMNYELIDKGYSYKEQDPSYKGEGLDRELANGPSEDRKCRDCLCFILYIAFWAAMTVVALYAFSNGNPQLLAAPFDSTGRQCGFGSYQDYPLAYYSNLKLGEFGCVQSCPTDNLSKFGVMFNGSLQSNSRFPSYATLQLVSLCFPVSAELNQYVNTGLGYFDRTISDLKATWQISLVGLFAALMLSMLLLVFIRVFGSCIVVSVIVLYLVGLVLLGVGCHVAARDGVEGYDEYANPELLQTAAYVCWVAAGLSFLLLLCSIKKIRIAAAVIRTSAQFTREQCRVIVVPLLMFLSIAVFFVFWLYSSIYIFSCGEVRPCGGSPYACIDWEVGVKRSLGLFLFGLFWNCEVAIAVCQFVIASTAAYWYFAHLGRSSFPLLRSFCRALTLQLGSLVFGALILCIVWVLQIMLEFLHYAAKKNTINGDPATNICSDYCIRCARCCLACFERFVRFVTKNAFLMMAISGEGFCSAAHQAFYLAMRSSGEYAITHGVGHTVMFFGKLLVSVAVSLVAYLMATELVEFSSAIYSPLTPTVMSFVISYVVGSFFMDVFAVAADTILLCYCIEMDIQRGMSYACPPELKHILDSQRR